MSSSSFAEHHPTRAVLALVLSPRFAGYAVIDGFGLARQPRIAPAGSWDLRAAKTRNVREATIRNLLARALRWHRPSAVVIGIDPSEDQLVCDAIMRICSRYVSRVSVECRNAGIRALGWSRNVDMREATDRLTRHFLPELASELRRYPRQRSTSSANTWRYRRTAWQAAALALRELAQLRPLSAAALVRDRPPRMPLLDEMARAAQLTEFSRAV